MTDMATALARALAAPRPPATTWGLVDALGGRREGTRALANLKMGRDVDARPPSSSTSPAEFKRYRAARRDIERWLEYERPTGKQNRRPPAEWLKEQRKIVRAAATRRNVNVLRRRGARARMFALVQVSDDLRDREMPAGGPGLALPRDDVVAFTDPFLDGDFSLAGSVFADVFMRRYRLGDGDIVDVHRVKIWPEGEQEQ